MAKKKVSMSAKIRALLDKGVEPKQIAKKLKIGSPYVHTVKWAWANKGKEAKLSRPVVDMIPDAPVPTPTPTYNTLDLAIRNTIMDRVEQMINDRIDKVIGAM